MPFKYSSYAQPFFHSCFVIISLSQTILSYTNAIAFDEVTSLHTWITVSSLANKDPNNHRSLIFRQIELNWINAPLDDSGDYIALYLDSQPDSLESLPVSVYKINGRTSGKIVTNYYLPQIDFFNETAQAHEEEKRRHQEAGGVLDQRPFRNVYAKEQNDENEARWHRRSKSNQQQLPQAQQTNGNLQLLVDECIGYCLAYHSRKRILAKNCLTAKPTWMQDSFSHLAARSLPSIMLPGTHNSATYLRGPLDKSVLQMINKYQMNQDETIFNQLVYGIRYLDLRIGYSKVKSRPERFWVYHDIFRTEVSADEVFEQVRRFLDLTTHEIIIMDFHRFTVGFQNENIQIQRERHAKLTELLFKYLAPYLIPSYLGQHAPIQEYIGMGKRLLVGYSGRSQLVGSQSADQHHSIFDLYQKNESDKDQQQSAGFEGKNKIRDIDAHKQDQEDSLILQSVTQATNNGQDDQDDETSNGQSQTENLADRRVGTRIYNKLKSLKLISHSFSKRSASDEKQQRNPLVTKTNGTNQAHSNRLLNSDPTPNEETRGEVSANLAGIALFFGPVRHLWPNKDTLEGLAQYMNETTCRRYFGELRSMMVELTPTVFGAISDKYDGNRKLAQITNRPVTDWIRDRWLHCINIVASDFFLGNDLIRLAIHANKRRVLSRHTDSGASVSLAGGQICKRLRKIEHLIDKSKIPIQFAYQPDLSAPKEIDEFAQVPMLGINSIYNNKDEDIIMHYSPSGSRILLRPLDAGSMQSSQSSTAAGGQASQSRERRDSFVDNVSDGFADLFYSFKRLFNL